MKAFVKLTAASLALAAAAAAAAGDTKDIVLDSLSSRTAPSMPMACAAPSEAMVLSVLQEAADGTLIPQPTSASFRTGDRLRVRMLAWRDARVSIYNTNPQGELASTPIWQGEVQAGQETLSDRLRLNGHAGMEQLHVVMEPPHEPSVAAWLASWLQHAQDGSDNEAWLHAQDTPTATYLFGRHGPGLVATLRVRHR